MCIFFTFFSNDAVIEVYFDSYIGGRREKYRRVFVLREEGVDRV